MRQILLALIATFISAGNIEAEEPTIEDRLIKIEAEIGKLKEEILVIKGEILALKEGQKFLNRRIDDVRADMNARFEMLKFWLQLTFGALVVIIGGLVAQWAFMWRRIVATEKVVETHLAEKEEKRLIALYKEEIELLKDSLKEVRERLKMAEAPA